MVPWSLKTRWNNCLDAIEGKTYIITHIFREGNMVADLIANKGFGLSDFTWWYSVMEAAMNAYNRNLECLKKHIVR